MELDTCQNRYEKWHAGKHPRSALSAGVLSPGPLPSLRSSKRVRCAFGPRPFGVRSAGRSARGEQGVPSAVLFSVRGPAYPRPRASAAEAQPPNLPATSGSHWGALPSWSAHERNPYKNPFCLNVTAALTGSNRRNVEGSRVFVGLPLVDPQSEISPVVGRISLSGAIGRKAPKPILPQRSRGADEHKGPEGGGLFKKSIAPF
jgi:hypothetical protein